MRNVKEPQTQTTTKPMNQFLQDQQWLPPLFSCCLRSSEKSVIKYRAEVITGKISAPYLEVSCRSSDCCCCCLVTKSCPTLLRSYGLQPARLLCPQDFPGTDTGVGCHFLLQGILLTQGLNPCLWHLQLGSLSLCHQGCPQFWLL